MGTGMGQAGERREREGKECWTEGSLSLVKAGDWVLCNGSSRSGTCDPRLVLQGSRGGYERIRNPKACSASSWPHTEGLGARSRPSSSAPAVGEASLWRGTGLIQIHPLFLTATRPSSLS